jgi:hypothetical protein
MSKKTKDLLIAKRRAKRPKAPSNKSTMDGGRRVMAICYRSDKTFTHNVWHADD